jgi:hypothetical protein
MTNIISLTAARKTRRRSKADGITLCQTGFHKWQPDGAKEWMGMASASGLTWS